MNQDLEKATQSISASFPAPLSTNDLDNAIKALWDTMRALGNISYIDRVIAQNVFIQRWKNETLFTGIENLSPAALDRIYAHAYEEGHSSGWNNIESEFEALVDLIHDVQMM